VTVLHLGSEKTDGIDHSWARPLAREVIALRLLVQLLATAPETADGTALFAMRPFPRSKTYFSVRQTCGSSLRRRSSVSSWSPCAWRALRSSKLALAVAFIQDADNAERAPACRPSAGHSRAQCRPVPAFGRHSRAQCRPSAGTPVPSAGLRPANGVPVPVQCCIVCILGTLTCGEANNKNSITGHTRLDAPWPAMHSSRARGHPQHRGVAANLSCHN